MIVCVPSPLFVTVAVGDFPSFPSLITVSVLLPSGLMIVTVCVPSLLFLTVTVGETPSFPSLPSLPSLIIDLYSRPLESTIVNV